MDYSLCDNKGSPSETEFASGPFHWEIYTCNENNPKTQTKHKQNNNKKPLNITWNQEPLKVWLDKGLLLFLNQH